MTRIRLSAVWEPLSRCTSWNRSRLSCWNCYPDLICLGKRWWGGLGSSTIPYSCIFLAYQQLWELCIPVKCSIRPLCESPEVDQNTEWHRIVVLRSTVSPRPPHRKSRTRHSPWIYIGEMSVWWWRLKMIFKTKRCFSIGNKFQPSSGHIGDPRPVDVGRESHFHV